MYVYVLLFLCSLMVQTRLEVSGVSERDPICERDLLIVRDELGEYVKMLADSRASENNLIDRVIQLQRRVSQLDDYAARKDKELWHMNNVLNIHRGIMYFLLFLVSIKVLWWLLPQICWIARLIIGAWRLCLSWLVSLPSRLISRFRANAGSYEEIPLRDIQVSPSFAAEAMLPNSPLVNVEKYDQCIFKIFVIDSDFPDKLHFSGLGFWCNAGETPTSTDGYFLTAAHVLPAEGDIMLRSANDEKKEYKMGVRKWTLMEDYDVAYFRPPQKMTTTLGLRKAKVMKNTLKQSVVVSVYGRDKTSCGPLKTMEKTIYLMYEGSSVGGFSGSPYMSGKTVCGLHIGSSKENGMGIDAAFLSMKLRRNLRLESSEDFIYDEIHKAMNEDRELDWRDYGLDDVVVTVRGKDYFFDYNEFHGLMELAKKKNKHYKYSEESVKKEAYSDIEGLPKNCLSPTPALVVGDIPVPAARSPPNPKLQKLSSLPDVKVNNDMNGLASTVAQLNEALQSMSTSMKDLVKKQESHERAIGSLYFRLSAADAKKPGAKAQASQQKKG